MAADINLIPEASERDIASHNYRRRLAKAAFNSLLAIGLVIIAIIFYQVYLSTRASSIAERTNAAEGQILQHQQTEVANLTLKDKLEKIHSILQDAMPTSDLITALNQAARTSPAVVISNLSVEENGDVIVEGSVANSRVFNDWVSNLTEKDSEETFGRVNLSSLTKSSKGYTYSLRLQFIKRGVLEGI